MIFDVIGLVGVSLILAGYFFVQTGRMTADQLPFPTINLAGASLILISLFHTFNLASFVIEIAWILISLFGIGRILRRRRRGGGNEGPA